jgi:hypothetical protein
MVEVTARSAVAVGQPPDLAARAACVAAGDAVGVRFPAGFVVDAETDGAAEDEADEDADADAVGEGREAYVLGDAAPSATVPDPESEPEPDTRTPATTTPPTSTVAATAIRTCRRRPAVLPRRWREVALLLLTSSSSRGEPGFSSVATGRRKVALSVVQVAPCVQETH